MKFTVTQDTNFIRIFRMPQKFPNDYCFQGGHDVMFKLVDWFGPLSQIKLFDEVILEGKDIQKKRDKISKFVQQKQYFDPNFQYLALTDYGDAFTIQSKEFEDRKKAEIDESNKLIKNLMSIDKWAGEIKKGHIKGLSINGSCPCPICEANLNWVIRHNGHLWARCETANCVNIAE